MTNRPDKPDGDLPARLARLFPGRWHRHYVAAKLRTDPLYAAVFEELRASSLPLLDIGCGIGLLAFYLRARGVSAPILGIDYDETKITEARRAAETAGNGNPDPDRIEFRHLDTRDGLPPHLGNVCLLDVLQYLSPADQKTLLAAAAERTAPAGRLVIRSGLHDNSWRHRITRSADIFAKLTFWMKSAPVAYPTREDFEELLGPLGNLTIRPLWGHTPFNNYLIVLEKGDSGASVQ